MSDESIPVDPQRVDALAAEVLVGHDEEEQLRDLIENLGAKLTTVLPDDPDGEVAVLLTHPQREDVLLIGAFPVVDALPSQN